MSKEIQELEDKLIVIRNNIKKTSLSIMRNRGNLMAKPLIRVQKKKLSELGSEYKDIQYKISDLRKRKGK